MPYPTDFLRGMLGALLAACGLSAHALNNNYVEPPPWQEQAQTVLPETFSLEGLIPVANPTRSSLSYGIAPDTVTIGPDQVVRYVVVAQSTTGAMNVLYEGVRCDTREVLIYGNWRADSGWRVREDGQWQALRNANSRYAQTLANDGFCDVRIVFGSAEQIVKRLREASKLY